MTAPRGRHGAVWRESREGTADAQPVAPDETALHDAEKTEWETELEKTADSAADP
jgi:hypothetical protein